MDWSTSSSAAFTVSSNVSTSAPVFSLRVGGGASIGAVVSGVSVISVLCVESSVLPLRSSTASSSRYRCGISYPMAACLCSSVRVIVICAPLPDEVTVEPSSDRPPEMPGPSRMKTSDWFTSASPVFTVSSMVTTRLPSFSSSVAADICGAVVSAMAVSCALAAKTPMPLSERSSTASAARKMCGSAMPMAARRWASLNTMTTMVPGPCEDTVAPVRTVPSVRDANEPSFIDIFERSAAPVFTLSLNVIVMTPLPPARVGLVVP